MNPFVFLGEDPLDLPAKTPEAVSCSLEYLQGERETRTLDRLKALARGTEALVSKSTIQYCGYPSKTQN
jgi:hypothetical protein